MNLRLIIFWSKGLDEKDTTFKLPSLITNDPACLP